jgi:type VI secretion system secreted protein Hcp
MILMKIDGVDGTSKIKGHDKWIQCESVDWSIGRPMSQETGRTMDRTGTVAQANEIQVTKLMDSSSTKLFELSCGKEGKKVEIHFLSGAGADAPTYSEWTLENTLISQYSINSSGQQDRATETIKLNFVTIEIKSIEKGADDKAGSPYPVKFSRESGTLG